MGGLTPAAGAVAPAVSDRRWPEAPGGFARRVRGSTALYAAKEMDQEVQARGLDAWAAWKQTIDRGAASSGRGMTAIVRGGVGGPWRLKLMRRGGRLAALWRDRYWSAQRLVAVVAASEAARQRGVPTARPVALILEAGPADLVRGGMAFEEIEGVEDLGSRLVRGTATRDELTAAMTEVRRMHDRGVIHNDLNLGNLLIRAGASGPPEAFIIDFDGALLLDRPAPLALRRRALGRLSRSCAKLTGSPAPLGPGSDELWYAAYAGADGALARGLARGRALQRIGLAVHRLGWKRTPR
jgi:hypothetical protein